jgi:hypothetical protein
MRRRKEKTIFNAEIAEIAVDVRLAPNSEAGRKGIFAFRGGLAHVFADFRIVCVDPPERAWTIPDPQVL